MANPAPIVGTIAPTAPSLEPSTALRTGNRIDRSVRRVVFWLHLTAGIVAGVVVLIMSVTGVLLAYQRQMLDRQLTSHVVSAPANGERLPLDSILISTERATGERATSVNIGAASTRPVAILLESRTSAFVDPYTGKILGDDRQLRAFFTEVERWHRSAGIGVGTRDPTGKAVTGASNLIFFFLLLSGLYLWIPRRWRGHAVRSVMVLDARARGKARDWNWHHVLGFWSAPFLLFVVGGALFISYSWPMAIVSPLVGGPPYVAARVAPVEKGGGTARESRGGEAGRSGAARTGAEGAERAGRETTVVGHPGVNLDVIWAKVAPRMHLWDLASLRLPRDGSAPVSMQFSRGFGARPDERITVTANAKTGDVIEIQGYESGDPARRFRSWVRPVHTGEVFGVAGQTVAMLVSLFGAVLVCTGISLAVRRSAAWLRRRSRGAPIRALPR